MSTQIITIPCLSDNYAYLMHDGKTGKTILIDAPEASPIIAYLKKNELELDAILITHHHDDHINGIYELQNLYQIKLYGAQQDSHRLPKLDCYLSDNQAFSIESFDFTAIDVSGHTIGHLAYYAPQEKCVFTGDSLMTLGCGRLFEGTANQMYGSLTKLLKLPDDTLIYSGHEYALNNAKFALTIEPENKDLNNRFTEISRKNINNIPTVPVSLAEEKKTNPFLRFENVEIRARLGLEEATNACVFTEIRKRKDEF